MLTASLHALEADIEAETLAGLLMGASQRPTCPCYSSESALAEHRLGGLPPGLGLGTLFHPDSSASVYNGVSLSPMAKPAQQRDPGR